MSIGLSRNGRFILNTPEKYFKTLKVVNVRQTCLLIVIRTRIVYSFTGSMTKRVHILNSHAHTHTVTLS